MDPGAILALMRKAAASFLLATLACLTLADSWCFVVSGDGRTDDKKPDPSGINLPILDRMVGAIRAEHPRFVVWTGDLIHGVYGNVKAPVDRQLQTWKSRMAKLNVTVLPVRGNHETYGDKGGAIWLRELKPVLDYYKVAYFKGQEGFSYTYTPTGDPKVAFIAVDQFISEHRVDLAGLEQALARAKKGGARNIFVCAHEMALTCDNHGDEDNMAKFKDDRNRFLDLLQRYGVRYFFAGHDHAYDWMVIRNRKWPKGYALNQIVAGTAGAPFYVDKGYYGDHDGFDLTRKEHRDDTYGYVLVRIDDRERVTVTFKPVKP